MRNETTPEFTLDLPSNPFLSLQLSCSELVLIRVAAEAHQSLIDRLFMLASSEIRLVLVPDTTRATRRQYSCDDGVARPRCLR